MTLEDFLKNCRGIGMILITITHQKKKKKKKNEMIIFVVHRSRQRFAKRIFGTIVQ
jgi:hypothetical protein